MKAKAILIILSLFISLNLTASNNSKPATNSRKAVNTATPIKNGFYKFSGKLNNRIPVFMWLIVKDSVIKGEVTYTKTKNKTPITLVGRVTPTDGAHIYEFTKAGMMTGIYRGSFNADTFTGIWVAPGMGDGKQLNYALSPKDTLLSKIDTTLKLVSITGEYAYHWGKDGGDGAIDIKQLPGNTIFASINCVTGAPANNLADVEPFKAKINRNTVIFKIPDTDCKFRIKAFKDFIVIDQVAGTGNCGFGMNASIEGVFLKTSNKPQIGQ